MMILFLVKCACSEDFFKIFAELYFLVKLKLFAFLIPHVKGVRKYSVGAGWKYGV